MGRSMGKGRFEAFTPAAVAGFINPKSSTMMYMKNQRHATAKAHSNAIGAFNPGSCLPAQIFMPNWMGFLFLPSDAILRGQFADTLRQLMAEEHSTVFCLVKLGVTATSAPGEASTIFVDKDVTIDRYHEMLTSGGPAAGWLYDVDCYACASDAGEWCIYLEKENDIAVIGFRQATAMKKLRPLLEKIGACRILDAVVEGKSPTWPFSHLTPEWLKKLTENYGCV